MVIDWVFNEGSTKNIFEEKISKGFLENNLLKTNSVGLFLNLAGLAQTVKAHTLPYIVALIGFSSVL